MKKIEKTEAAWREQLDEEGFTVCRLGGTERAFSGALLDEKREGVYHCRCCELALFESGAKFDSGSGWPSYFAPVDRRHIETLVDRSHGMTRSEIRCAQCGSHLGHVFGDGPAPTFERYCVNSASLSFKPKA